MNKITRLIMFAVILIVGIAFILYVYERQHVEPNILSESDVHTSECADPAYTLVADWGCKDWSSYIQELQMRAMATPLSEITEPQFTMTCSGNNIPYYGKIELKAFEKTLSGFKVYFMDGRSEWFSNGNACVIRDVHKLD